jgi:GalNAc-alpha-(1->4)-GalNAc-alpha-(1->3)-diNAcBac-PP-undecaprenol alpha-1,4-N-acetyl-D-galactosaminyltransferase
MPKKKIAFIIPHLNSGGAERVVTTLANELSKIYTVSIITYSKKKPFYALSEKVELLYCLESLNPSKNIFSAVISNLKLIIRLRKILRQKKIDVALSFLTSANVLSIISCKLLNIKVIISERNNPKEDRIQRMWKILRRNLYPYADRIVVQTDYIKSIFSAYIKKEEILILPNPINPELSNKRIENVNRKRQVLSVGRLTDQKNHELLIKAFARAKIRDWQLIIIGEGENRVNYEQLIKDLNLKDKVCLIGRQKDMAKYYNTCSVFAFSSNYEGFPNALIEAMHFGMACISTDCPTGPSELISNEVNGLLVPMNDTTAMCEGLLRLMNEEKTRMVFGEEAKNTVEDFRHSKVVYKWRNLINEID